MVKPAERNTKYIDMVMTIPKVSISADHLGQPVLCAVPAFADADPGPSSTINISLLQCRARYSQCAA